MKDFKNFDVQLISYHYGISAEDVDVLRDLIDRLNSCFKKEVNNFAETCFVVYRIKQVFDSYYTAGHCYDKNKRMYRFIDIMKGFGLDASEVSRLISCFEKFIFVVEDNARIDDCFLGFSKTKLWLLLSIPNNQLKIDISNKVLRPDMSYKSIQEYVKNYKAMVKVDSKQEKDELSIAEEEFDETEVPDAYDPSKEYDFSYFEDKTKSQLLNIVWELQKAYQKLKRGKKKIENS